MLRKYAAGAALVAALVTGLTACSKSSTPAEAEPKPAASKAPQPAEVLAAAVAKTATVPVKFEIGDASDKVTGGFDAANRIGMATMESDGDKMQLTMTDNEVYVGGMEALEGKALKLDASRLNPEGAIAMLASPLAGVAMLGAATEITSPGPNQFAGKVDLAKVTATATTTKKFVEAVVKNAADKGGVITFTAKTTADGYLAEFDTVLPKLDEGKDARYVLKLSDFGAPVSVAKPTKVVEAPADTYKDM
jgi:hypothetical protein